MAGLTEFQIDWVETAGGAEAEITDDAYATAEKKVKGREDALKKIVTEGLEAHRQQISEAQVFDVVTTSDSKFLNAVWKKVLGKEGGKQTKMKWRAEDEDLGYFGWDLRADVEVDTDNDLEGVDEIPPETIQKLNDAYQKLMIMQRDMLEALDEDGERVFSDKDIMSELWSPLVRDGTIPENLVPQRFSEHAQAFKGAAELYQARIDEYSEQSHGKEGLIRGLKIGAETVSLIGTIAVSSVTIANATEMADINNKLNDTQNPPSTEQEALLKARQSELKTMEQLTTLGATLVSGGMELTISGVEESAKGRQGDWTKFADTSLKVLSSVVAAAVGPIANISIGHDEIGKGSDGAKSGAALAEAIKGGLLAGIAGVRMGPALLAASRAKTPAERQALLEKAYDLFADGVGKVLTAVAAKQSDQTTVNNLAVAASSVPALLKAMKRVPKALQALEQGKPDQAAALLIMPMAQGLMMGLSRHLTDAGKRNVDQETYDKASKAEQGFMEVTDDPVKLEKAQMAATAGLIGTLDAQAGNIEQKMLDFLAKREEPQIDPGAKSFAAEMARQMGQEQQELANAELEEFFGVDGSNKANIELMFAEFDQKLVGYEDLYKDAMPDTDLAGKPPDEIERGLEAIQRAMAQTSMLRARAEMINTVTGAGAAVLASFVPGAGAVVAAQKVAFDIYALSKAVQMHNKWVDSMEIAFRAYSAYAPAIQKTMINARITLSQASVKLVLDSLKLGSEIGKCFDPTGGAAIASATLTMTAALVDYGYKMRKEVEITTGWNAYVKARENPANRKAARAALRMNSTLAKCCIAYGACIAGDASAKEAISRSGLTPAILSDSNDICKALVAYLENELTDDPIVMQVEKQPKKWQPGKPELRPDRWFEIKAAAATVAVPRLDPGSVATPGIDRTLTELTELWQGSISYAAWRKAHGTGDGVAALARAANARQTIALLKSLQSQMSSYAPMQAGSKMEHEEMADIAATYTALAQLTISSAQADAA